MPFLSLVYVSKMWMEREDSCATAVSDVGTPWLFAVIGQWPPYPHEPYAANPASHLQWMIISSKFITVFITEFGRLLGLHEAGFDFISPLLMSITLHVLGVNLVFVFFLIS